MEEQLLILRMLEDGKITADQATELLLQVNKRAPNEHVTDHSGARQSAERQAATQARRDERQRSRQLREEERRARHQIKRVAKQTSLLDAGKVSDQIERVVQNSLSSLGLGGGSGRAFTKSLSGQFLGGQPEVRVQNTNGRLVFGVSPDDHWHLTLTVRVRAASDQAAKNLAESLVSVKQTGASLAVESKRLFGRNASVDVDLLLPREQRILLSASCTNGTISLNGLVAGQAVLRTVNGRIRADQFDIDRVEAHAVNGSMTFVGTAKKVNCHAANGRLQIALASQGSSELELETINGSIEVTLPAGEGIGYVVDAVSTTGAVDVVLPEMVQETLRQRSGRRQVQGQSRELSSKPWVQSVRAKALSGRIRINTEGGTNRNV